MDVNNNYKYDNVYASRTVVKNKYYNRTVGLGYYNCDVWGEANKVLIPLIPKGYTLYYEIVGFLPTGGYIQKDYDYGCLPPEEGENYTICQEIGGAWSGKCNRFHGRRWSCFRIFKG